MTPRMEDWAGWWRQNLPTVARLPGETVVPGDYLSRLTDDEVIDFVTRHAKGILALVECRARITT